MQFRTYWTNKLIWRVFGFLTFVLLYDFLTQSQCVPAKHSTHQLRKINFCIYKNFLYQITSMPIYEKLI